VVSVVLVGGPTALIEIGGLRLLTDPTFDPPGDYPVGSRKLTKLGRPAVAVEELGHIDAVLLSHDQHPDNLDHRGREVLAAAPVTFSTPAAAERLKGSVRALANWESAELTSAGRGGLTITAVPALHGPPGSESLVGPVTGFLLSGNGLPSIYVSGDNASLEFVREIAARFAPVDVAILFAGGARTALLGDAYLTLPSAGAAEAARILDAREVVPIHFEGWAHFSQGADTLREAFMAAGLTERLRLLDPGDRFERH
jgi:L-ascorbate metabolism protein UlaG (beta-lactamase superfamily)